MTLLELLDRTAGFFASKSVESPRLQAELLVAHVLQKPRMALYLEFARPMADAELDALRPLVRRRADGEPLQHILGHTEFYGLRLACSPAALVPRPETEVLVDLVVETLIKLPPGHLIDVGTGSGCVALACAAHLPDWKISATDTSPDALALARANAASLNADGVTWHEGNLLGPVAAENPRAVVANLPYLTHAEMADLPPEVRNDPPAALDGGEDGLDCIRALCASLPASVSHCFLESGSDQTPAIRELLAASGFNEIRTHPDLTGRPRHTVAVRQV